MIISSVFWPFPPFVHKALCFPRRLPHFCCFGYEYPPMTGLFGGAKDTLARPYFCSSPKSHLDFSYPVDQIVLFTCHLDRSLSAGWCLPGAEARLTLALPCSRPELLPAAGTALAHLWAVTCSVPSDKTLFPALPGCILIPQQVSASVEYP